MITISTAKIKHLTTETYNKLIEALPIHQLSCSCGQSACMIKHAYYTRSIKVLGRLIKLRILRLICKHCNKTHSILPDWIVPYSRVLLTDHLKIIKAYQNNNSYEDLMIENVLIDESNLSYILKKYKLYWKERLFSYKICLDLNLTQNCIKHFKRQFMQIKSTTNILFSHTHTT